MDAQRRDRFPQMRWFYIYGYAGSGHHVSKTRRDLVEGSPLIALNTKTPFHEYHFIDSDTGRAAELRKEAGDRDDVFTYSEDCNTVLLRARFFREPIMASTNALFASGPLQYQPDMGSDRSRRQGSLNRDFPELYGDGHQS